MKYIFRLKEMMANFFKIINENYFSKFSNSLFKIHKKKTENLLKVISSNFSIFSAILNYCFT